jgi:hypothetical protein
MIKWCCVVLLVLMMGAQGLVLAQSPAPERLTLAAQGLPNLSLTVPSGWLAALNPPSNNLYAIMTNRNEVRPGEEATDVQLVIRSLEELAQPIEATLDPESENPALEYLTQYAAWKGNRVEGIYDPPQALESGDYPSAMMLYIERSPTARFGQATPGLLSLSLAVYLGEGQMAVILMDGVAQSGQVLLATWINILRTLELDGTSPPFVADLEAILAGFNAPDNMRSVYEAIVGGSPLPAPTSAAGRFPFPENTGVYLKFGADQEIGLPLFGTWTVTRQALESAEWASNDGSAQIRAAIQALPAEYSLGDLNNLLGFLAQSDQTELAEGDPLAFFWGDMIASVALTQTLSADQPDGMLLAVQLPDLQSLLVVRLRFLADVPRQTLLDWRDTLALAQLNGVEIGPDEILLALLQFPIVPADQ